MWINYLKILLRNSLKNLGFTLTNILGLSLGIGSCLVITLYLIQEISYDKYHVDYQSIFRVYNERTYPDKVTYGAALPVPFAPSVDNTYSQITDILEIRPSGNRLFKRDDLLFHENNGIYGSTKAFNFFSFEILAGNVSESFDEPNKIILTKNLAQKYFNERWEESIGQSIFIDNTANYSIAAVIDDLPDNFHLSFSYILSFNSLESILSSRDKGNWLSPRHYVYFKLNDPKAAASIEKQLDLLAQSEVDPKTVDLGYYYRYFLQPLSEVHLHSNHIRFDIASHGNAEYVQGLSIIAGLILLLACANFVSISTARASQRSKEVGLRKVSGAKRWEIALQFLVESFFIVLMATIFGALLVEVTLPFFNLIIDKNLSFTLLNNASMIATLGGVLFFTAVLSGGYTAFYISGIQPSRVLKEMKGTIGFNRLRRALVVFQFSITMTLIVGSIFIYKQLNFLQNKNLGLNTEQVVVVPVTEELNKDMPAIKEQMMKSSAVLSATASYGLPGRFIQGDNIEVAKTNNKLPISMYLTDDNFLTTLDLEIVAGRDFNGSLADQHYSYIVNEKAANMLGYTAEAAIGEELIWDVWISGDTVKQGPIIGVVKDFNYRSLQDDIGPVVIHQFRERVTYLSVKVEEANIEGALAYISEVYKRFEPNRPFEYSFLDSDFERFYLNEKMLSALLKLFTGLAVLIACLGLLGLTAYSTYQKRKELGIRKVHGATVRHLLAILHSDLLKTLIISSLIAFPVIFYIISEWLNTYANRITMSAVPFILTFSLMSILSMIIMFYHIAQAININPAIVLRNE